MTMTTFSLPASFPVARKAPTRGLFARMFDALIEARMRRAAREIAMRRHLLPENLLKGAGYEVTVTKDGSLPFAR